MLKQVTNSKRPFRALGTVASVPALMAVVLPETVQAHAGPIAQKGRELDFRSASSRTPKFLLMYEYKHRVHIGSAGHDAFGHTSGTLAFRPNERSKTVRFVTYSDQWKESDESVRREATDGQAHCLRHGRRIKLLRKLQRAERVQFHGHAQGCSGRGQYQPAPAAARTKNTVAAPPHAASASRVAASCRLAPGLSERQARSRPTGEER